MPLSFQPCTYSDFKNAAITAGCQAISSCYRPTQSEEPRIFSCALGELLATETFSVHATNASRTDFLPYNDPGAQPILLRDLVTTPHLVQRFLSDRAHLAGVPLDSAALITIHCAGCFRRIVLDGTHRLSRLGSKRSLSAPVSAFELSGRLWPRATPDMNIVCQCDRSALAV